MNYHGRGMYQWDTWYCKRGRDEVHAFYLQCLRPGSERTALEADSIGHAVTYNLFDWEELPPALPPEKPGELGDLTNWTGSTIEHEGKYYMYYTMRSSADSAKIQMIGLATSDDLMLWTKHTGNPILTPDSKWYNTKDNPAANSLVDCRDLMVVKHDELPGYYGVYATRVHSGELPEGAVFAGAYTEDMVTWEQSRPVYRSDMDRYSIVEMPDLFKMQDKWYLTWLEDTSYGNRDIFDETYLTSGTLYAVADKVEGPYIAPPNNILIASMGFNGFSCRTVDFHGKKYLLYSMAERQMENEFKHTFGSLSLPKEVKVIDGKLCACYADIMETKLGTTLIDPASLPPTLDWFHNYHETQGQWNREGNVLSGSVRTAWARQTFDAECSNFVYSADITVTKGVAAGLLVRQGAGRNGGVALLDFERQIVGFYTVPRFQTVDMRKIELIYGQTYNIKVVGNHQFIEVFIDDVLYLQFVHYFNERGNLGLLVDRAEGQFANIRAQELNV